MSNIIIILIFVADDKPEVVCYWGSWSIYRNGLGQYKTENIDPKLCTIIVYTFVGLNTKLEVDSLDQVVDITSSEFAFQCY